MARWMGAPELQFRKAPFCLGDRRVESDIQAYYNRTSNGRVGEIMKGNARDKVHGNGGLFIILRVEFL